MPLKTNGMMKWLRGHAETFVVMCAAGALFLGLLTRFVNFSEIARSAGLATAACADSLRRQDSTQTAQDLIQTVRLCNIDTSLVEMSRRQQLIAFILVLRTVKLTGQERNDLVVKFLDKRHPVDTDSLLLGILGRMSEP